MMHLMILGIPKAKSSDLFGHFPTFLASSPYMNAHGAYWYGRRSLRMILPSYRRFTGLDGRAYGLFITSTLYCSFLSWCYFSLFYFSRYTQRAIITTFAMLQGHFSLADLITFAIYYWQVVYWLLLHYDMRYYFLYFLMPRLLSRQLLAWPFFHLAFDAWFYFTPIFHLLRREAYYIYMITLCLQLNYFAFRFIYFRARPYFKAHRSAFIEWVRFLIFIFHIELQLLFHGQARSQRPNFARRATKRRISPRFRAPLPLTLQDIFVSESLTPPLAGRLQVRLPWNTLLRHYYDYFSEMIIWLLPENAHFSDAASLPRLSYRSFHFIIRLLPFFASAFRECLRHWHLIIDSYFCHMGIKLLF